MSGEREFTVRLLVTDYGIWNPENEQSCAQVIAAVNRMRRPDNKRPKIRRDDWGDDRKTWLDAEIGNTSMRIDPGEHLVRTVLPDGSEEWSPMPADMLASLEPSR